MAAEDNAKGWFLHSHGQARKFGPLTEDELRSLVSITAAAIAGTGTA